MVLQKKDFIEIEFTGKTREGQIFDSNIEKDLKEINSEIKAKPLIFCLGEDMFLKGVDDYLIGKEVGKYKIELTPENAFGKRDSTLVKMIPMKVFIQHKINPIKGSMLNFDGKMGKVLSVSGGRVLVDFNNPLAGKDVVYDVNIKRKIKDLNEKIKSFNEFLFRQNFKFEIKDTNTGKKVIYEVEEKLKQFVEMFKDKFKEIFGMDLEIKSSVPQGVPSVKGDVNAEDKKKENIINQKEKKEVEIKKKQIQEK